MAKKSRQAEKDEKRQPGKQSVGSTLRTGQRSLWYMGLISLALVAWTVWRLEPSLGFGKALLWGGVLGLAWVGFIILYYLSQRTGNRKDK